jgi:hypothetical protein
VVVAYGNADEIGSISLEEGGSSGLVSGRRDQFAATNLLNIVSVHCPSRHNVIHTLQTETQKLKYNVVLI